MNKWLAALVSTSLVLAAGCSFDDDEADSSIFATAKAEDDMSVFGPGLSGTGSLIVEAAFETHDGADVLVMASASFATTMNEGDESAVVYIWLELDSDDDPDRCRDQVRAERTAFRSAAVSPSAATTEITVVAPVEVGESGSHSVAVCAQAYNETGPISTVAASVAGVVSSNSSNMIEFDILPS